MQNTDNKLIQRIIMLIISLSLFILAVLIRSGHLFGDGGGLDFFISPYTGAASAQMLFHDYPPPGEIFVFRHTVKTLALNFSMIYISSLVLFITSIYIALNALIKSGRGEVLSFLDRIWSLSEEKPLLVAFYLFLITIILMIPLQRIVVGDNLTSSDEFSYLFQSKVLLKGKLYADSPLPVAPFCSVQIVNNGKWYSKYTTGLPLILTAGSIFNIPWIVNCLLSAIVIMLVFYAGREIYDGRTGILSAFFLLLSPMFVLNGLTMYPHTSHLLFVLLFTFLFFRSLKHEGKWYHPFLAGISLGFALLIRPAGTVICAFIFFIYTIVLLVTGKFEKKLLLKRFSIAMGGFVIGFAVLLLINKIQNGSFTTFAYNVYDRAEKWGIGNFGHDYIKGFWNTLVSTSRLGFWTSVLMLESALIALFEKKKENYFLFALIIIPITFFFFFYSLGVIEFGPRFYFVFLGFLAILASRGIISAGYKLSKKFPNTNPVHLFLASSLIFMLLSIYPPILKVAYKFTRENSINIVRNLIESQTPLEKKVLVFLRSDPHNKCSVFNSNLPGLNERIITALFLDPDTNNLIRKKFEDRSCFILDFDYRVNRYIIRPDYNMPFEKRDENTKIQDLIFSSYNYARSVRDKEKAIEQIDMALGISPDNTDLLLIKASILMDMEDFVNAITILEKITIDKQDVSQAYYALGICNLKTGRKKEASDAFEKFLETRSVGANALKARFWIAYLQAEQK